MMLGHVGDTSQAVPQILREADTDLLEVKTKDPGNVRGRGELGEKGSGRPF